MFKPRKQAPTRPSNANDDQSFRVWANDPPILEDPLPWKCVAAFRYLQECMDFIAYCQDRGTDVIYQSPADCRVVRATEPRVVFKAATL